ncbi:MAG: PD-(D/E)XK nuclease family protein [bacterium]|nr:PD-(D/E)XK nuclease family protein [bacterium]
MSWRPVAVEDLYREVAAELSHRRTPFERTSILVPDHAARERLLRFLHENFPNGFAGVEVVTLHSFVERISPDPPHPSKEILQLRFRKYLHSLPEQHPFAPLRQFTSGVRTLIAAAEEMIEADVETPPKLLSAELIPFANALLEVKLFAQKAHVGHRAVQYRNAANVIQNLTFTDSAASVLPSKLIFVGFYDFATSQCDFFLALTRAIRRRDGNTTAICFLLPTAQLAYAGYTRRIIPFLQKTLGLSEAGLADASRADQRLSGEYCENKAEAINAPDEAGEIDALLRKAVEYSIAGIPYSEQAILLPSLEPYDALLREAAALHDVPLQFIDGAPLHRTEVGNRVLALLRWIDEPDELAFVEFALRAIGIQELPSQVWKAIQSEYNTDTNIPLPIRFQAVAKRLSPNSTARCNAILAVLQSPSGEKLCEHWRNLLQLWQQEIPSSDTEPYDTLRKIITEAALWFAEEPRMESKEWHSLLLRKLLSEQQSPGKNRAGVWAGRIHALRGALFRVVHLPGGGATMPGGDSAVLPEAIRSAWNQEAILPYFGTAADRESEMQWLFAMAIGQGEHCVVTTPKYTISTGTETSESPLFDDYRRSCHPQDAAGKLLAPLTNRLQLAKRFSLSPSDAEVSRRLRLPTGVTPNDNPAFSTTQLKVQEWGDLQGVAISETQLNRIRDSHILGNFFECPLRGLFSHLLTIDVADRDDPTARLLGKVVHKVLEKWQNSLALAEAANWEETIASAIREVGGRAAMSDPIEYALLARGAKSRLLIWQKLRKELPGEVVHTEMEKWIGTKEQPENIPLSNGESAPLKGRVDVVETMSDHTIRLLDFKTGRVDTEKKETHTITHVLQGPLYAIAAELGGWGQVADVIWMYLHPKAHTNWKLSGDELTTAKTQALALVATIRENTKSGCFFPTPEPLPFHSESVCSHCDFESICGERVQILTESNITNVQRNVIAGLQYRRQYEAVATAEDGENE